MSTGAWVFLFLVWSVVIYMNVFCFRRLLTLPASNSQVSVENNEI